MAANADIGTNGHLNTEIHFSKRRTTPTNTATSAITTIPTSKRFRLLGHYRVLLWKSFLIRRRHPFLLCAELIFPILFVSILAIFRSQQTLTLESACHVQSQSMPSMGLLHYVQSMICNFNYTCYPEDPDEWETMENFSPLIYMLHNLTELVQDPAFREFVSEPSKFKLTNFFQRTLLIPKLFDLYTAYSHTIQWISTHYPLIQSQISINSLKNMSNLICGSRSNLNDIWRVAQLLEEHQTSIDKSETTSTTRSPLDSLWDEIPARNISVLNTNLTKGQQRAQMLNLCELINYLLTLKPIYNTMGRLRHFLFGKVAYYPSNPWTDLIIKQSDFISDLLKQLRHLVIHYFSTTRPWLVDYLSDTSKMEPLRHRFADCVNSNSPFLTSKIRRFCNFSLNWLNSTANQNRSMFSDWPTTLDQLDFMMGIAEDLLTNCFEIDNKFVPFADYESWLEYLNYDSTRLRSNTLGLILNTSTQANFTAYLNSSLSSGVLFTLTLRKHFPFIDGTYKYKVLDRYWNPRPRRDPQIDMKYFTSGFIDIQEQISQALINNFLNQTLPVEQSSSKIHSNSIGVQMKLFPSNPYTNDKFLDFFSTSLPQLMVLAWSLSIVITVKYLVDEKEEHIIAILHTFGISKLLNQLAWLTSSFVLMFGLLIPTILILKYSQIIPLTSFSLVFLFIASYLVSCLGFALVMSTLFKRASLAAIVTGIVYFLLYLPAPLLVRYESQLSSITLILASVIPQIGYSLGWSFITRLEVHGSGAQWHNLWFSGSIEDPYCLGLIISLLWLASLIYLVITLFLNQITLDIPNLIRNLVKFRSIPKFRKRRTRISNMIDNHNLEKTDSSASCSFEIDKLVTKLPNPILNNPIKPSVIVQNLSKCFRFRKTCALNNICMTFCPDQITVLLGPNGAGKTTLISILVGLVKPSQGQVHIHNRQLDKQLDSIRHLIGYCPQHDILYPNLTVLEHIYLFGILKNLNMLELNQQLDIYLANLGFADKRHELSKTLSGGQKRKLSLFLAFMGPTSVVILDEPTAGLDPLSKGAIWDLLKSMRVGRTIILSSHHMRETEILADQIAVISKGQLFVTGSLGQLCDSHSPGYRIGLERDLTHPDFSEQDVHTILSLCCQYVQACRLVGQYPWKLILAVNSESAYDGSLEKLFDLFGSTDFKRKYDVTNLGLINIPLDEVFLDAIGILPTAELISKTDGLSNFNQHDTVSQNSNFPNSSYFKSNLSSAKFELDNSCQRQVSALLTKRYYHLKRNKLSWIIQFILPCLLVLISLVFVRFFRPKVTHPPMHIHPWLVQTKRIPHLVHFYSENNQESDPIGPVFEPYRTVFQKPYAWTGTRCISSQLYKPTPTPTSWGCSPTDQFESEFRNWSHSICSKHYVTHANPSCRQLATKDLLINLTGFNVANHLIGNENPQFIGRSYGGLEFGAIPNAHLNELLKRSLKIQPKKISKQSNVWLESLNSLSQLLPPDHILRVWYNNKGYTSAPAYLNMFHNLALKQIASQSSSIDYNFTNPIALGLAIVNHPLMDQHVSFFFNFRENLKSDSVVALFLLLTFSFIPANFILLLIRERQTQSKHLQYLAGLKPYLYWSVNLGCDFFIYVISTFICILFLIVFQKHAYIGLSTIVPFSLVILLYGLAMIPLIHLLSFTFSHPSTGFVFICALNLLISSITTTVSFFLKIMSIQYSDIETISNLIQNLFRLFPHFCLGSTIYDLAVNDFLIEYGLIKSDSMKAWQLLWPNMLFLGLQFLVFYSLVLCIEYRLILLVWKRFPKCQQGCFNWIGSYCQSQFSNQNSVLGSPNVSESAFVQIGPPAFEFDSVSKHYPSYGFTRKPKLVLSNLSFSVPYGHCFGLVGSNGAGKSTTYGILSGQISISNGTVRIHGCDTTTTSAGHRLAKTSSDPLSIGYCPQHDALYDFLTVRETLTMYAHFHSILLSSLSDHVAELIEQTGLTQYADCLASVLSGGNKRKLSTAIAFLGKPSLILLDEPSNGMDLLSKKLLWSNINRAVRFNKSAVLLSSHYMDECELLCQTVGLLEQGRLRCVGQPLELRNQISGDYFVRLHLNQTQVDHLGPEQFERKMQSYLPEFRLRLPTTVQQDCYCSSSLSMSQLFGLLRLVFELKLITYYTVQQSCLEDVLSNLIKSQ